MSDGIIKTSELPKIIPPLPTGDTKDLKVWQDYWKQHDEKIRQDATEKVLDDLEHYIQYETPLEQFSKYCLAYTDVLQKVKNLRKKDGE